MVALAVVLVLTGLSLAVLARALGALSASRRNQDGAAALAVAQAGLADAVYNISNSGPLADPQPDARGFNWVAHAIDNNTYTVNSAGTVNSVTRTVTEKVFRWPFALFTQHGLTISDSLAPDAIKIRDGDTGGAFVGSNSGISLGSGPGTGQVFFSPDGSCAGCSNPIGQPGPYGPDGPYGGPQLPSVPAGASPCPADWGSPPAIDGDVTPVLNPGTYVCDVSGGFTLTGHLQSPAAPVVIYLTGQGTLNLGGLAMTATTADNPTNLVIHMVDRGQIDQGPGFQFTGILDAPRAGLHADPCAVSVLGALSLDRFTCANVSSPFSLGYDSRSAAVLGEPWQVSGFQEIPTPASL